MDNINHEELDTNVQAATKDFSFENDIATLINRYSKENESDTPDFILAQYLDNCLQAYNRAVRKRDKWFNVDMWTEDKKLPIPKV